MDVEHVFEFVDITNAVVVVNRVFGGESIVFGESHVFHEVGGDAGIPNGCSFDRCGEWFAMFDVDFDVFYPWCEGSIVVEDGPVCVIVPLCGPRDDEEGSRFHMCDSVWAFVSYLFFL